MYIIHRHKRIRNKSKSTVTIISTHNEHTKKAKFNNATLGGRTIERDYEV